MDALRGRPSPADRRGVVMRFVLNRLRTQLRMPHGAGSRRRQWVLGTTSLAAAAVVFFVVSAVAEVSGSPSKFESNDGNMTVQTAGHTDWNCFANGKSTGFASGITVGQTCA